MGCCCCCGDGFTYKLRVNVVKAEGLGDYDVFGSVDAYVQVKHHNTQKKSKTIKNNKAPHWDEVLEFPGHRLNQGPITFVIMDWDRLTPDDFVGEATIGDTLPTEYNKIKELQFEVFDKKQTKSGTLTVKLEFTREET